MSSRVLLLAFLIVLPSWTFSAHAAAHLVWPWPSAEGAPVRVEQVTLRSSDPFAPSDVGEAPARAVAAQLYEPLHPAPDHSTPAAVLLHGSGGLSSARGERYGRELANMGVPCW